MIDYKYSCKCNADVAVLFIHSHVCGNVSHSHLTNIVLRPSYVYRLISRTSWFFCNRIAALYHPVILLIVNWGSSGLPYVNEWGENVMLGARNQLKWVRSVTFWSRNDYYNLSLSTVKEATITPEFFHNFRVMLSSGVRVSACCIQTSVRTGGPRYVVLYGVYAVRRPH